MSYGFRSGMSEGSTLVLSLLLVLLFSGIAVGLFRWLTPGLEWQVGFVIAANVLYFLFFILSLVFYLRYGGSCWCIVAVAMSLQVATLLICRYACPDYYIHDLRCSCKGCYEKYYVEPYKEYYMEQE